MTSDSMPAMQAKWHFDKRVPLALIATIIIQTAAIVWWASNIDNRVEQLEKDALDSTRMIERVTRVETHITAIQETLYRIDTKLDRMVERSEK